MDLSIGGQGLESEGSILLAAMGDSTASLGLVSAEFVEGHSILSVLYPDDFYHFHPMHLAFESFRHSHITHGLVWNSRFRWPS
jgi:hypothetical protein